MTTGDFFELFGLLLGLLAALNGIILLALKLDKIKGTAVAPFFIGRGRLPPPPPTHHTNATYIFHIHHNINYFFEWQAQWIGNSVRRLDAAVGRQLQVDHGSNNEDLELGNHRLRLMPADEEET
ncbi:hypothetical protein CKM354_001199900 [Cercospora kikuchii]|uniref:Uncharacterized protein n=1 Tax=Cercospora kikuchii TaxID=84275 RepID=A0A9P3CU33_9PEZI|nr:uncharacterized protein CKM354_001199900 [Cercospora kikuchii]GIZ48956.1 hypothetical protein CKM354_001199900 [Cercospora kikuchii]